MIAQEGAQAITDRQQQQLSDAIQRYNTLRQFHNLSEDDASRETLNRIEDARVYRAFMDLLGGLVP